MTSANSTELVQRYLDYLINADFKGLSSMHTDDVVFDWPGSSVLPWAGKWEGRERVEICLNVLRDALEIRSHSTRRWITEGNTVVVLGEEVSASRKSGKEFHISWAWVFTVLEDKISNWTAYEDTEATAACAPY